MEKFTELLAKFPNETRIFMITRMQRNIPKLVVKVRIPHENDWYLESVQEAIDQLNEWATDFEMTWEIPSAP